MKISEIKRYFHSLKFYIFLSSFIFLAGIASGYSFARDFPEETQIIMTTLQDFFSSTEEATDFQIFLFILENNVSKLLIMLLLGIFAGILPFFSSFINGMVLGIFGYIVVQEKSLEFLLVGILPHGIIEIPVLILSTAIGMRLGKVAVWRIFGGKIGIRKEFVKALKFYLAILVPLLFFAAIIEAFLTSRLLDFVK